MSDPPRYEKIALKSPSFDIERQALTSDDPLCEEEEHHQQPSASSSSSQSQGVAIPVPAPLPWSENEVRRPVTYLFEPPARMKGLGGDCSGVLGRTREETIAMIRRAFPTAFVSIPDDRIILSQSLGPMGRDSREWHRLSPDWFEMMFAPRPRPSTGLMALFEDTGPKWPKWIKVEIEPTLDEIVQLAAQDEMNTGVIVGAVGYVLGLILIFVVLKAALS